jgi:hypothetical protein
LRINTATKKCPMCNTQNDQSAQSCKYCGYIFEDFSTATPGVNTSSFSSQQQPENFESTSPAPRETSFSTIPASQSTLSSGTPLFVVTRSLLASFLPALLYLLVFVFLGLITFSISSIIYIAFFVVIALVPSLFSPRKYEFYDSSLKIHKIIGGDTEYPYSEMTLYGSRGVGRRGQIILSVTGKKGGITIPGNPMNQELGKDLNQFLETKAKKYNPPKTDHQQTSEQSETTMIEENQENATATSSSDNNYDTARQ